MDTEKLLEIVSTELQCDNVSSKTYEDGNIQFSAECEEGKDALRILQNLEKKCGSEYEVDVNFVNFFGKSKVYVIFRKKMTETASKEDKEAADALNGIADEKEKSGEKDKADALRNAAKIMSESVNKDFIDKLVVKLSEDFGIDISESDIEQDKSGISIALGNSGKQLPEDFAKILGEFCKSELKCTKNPEIYVDDTKAPKALYIDNIECVSEKNVNESVADREIVKFSYVFVVPEYVVEKFGKEAFLEHGFSETIDGKIVLSVEATTDSDMQEIFGADRDGYNSMTDDNLATIKTVVEELNNNAEDKLDVEVDTVIDDVETCWYAN